MNILRNAFVACCGVLGLSLPALAGVNVNSPANNATVTSPFKLSASASTCSSKPVTGMGYSWDSSSDTTSYPQQSLDLSLSASAGTHVLKVKAWSSGSACVVDITINVQAGTTSTTVPSYADTVSQIQAISGWRASHDNGGPGTSSGYTDIVSSPTKYGTTRRFKTSFTNNGDERYSMNFSDDVNAKHFFYDAWVYVDSSSSQIANIELDVNQVMANGETVLAGIQCDGWTGHWAYTANTGTASSPKPKWISLSGTTCNPRKWKQWKWHHIQYSFYRDDSGNLKYQAVWFDGVKQSLNASAFGAAKLGWGDTIQTQFQVDGYGSSGTTKVWVDNLTISRW